MIGQERIPVVLALLGAVAIASGCGGSDVSYKDHQIVDKLNLQKSKTDGNYILDGDQFCEVKTKLLNDSGEVSDAADKDKLGLVIASAAGNVGVEGVPVFSPDCKDLVKKKLNKLDPSSS
jgi:hypothetical protein